jgi:hypothetical protein
MAVGAGNLPDAPDSDEYRAVAHATVLSADFWGSIRPSGYPVLLLVAFHDVDIAIVLQTLVFIGAWITLACVLVSCMTGFMRPVAGLTVLGFAASSDVALWNRWVLTESLGTSLVALVLAAGLLWAQSRDDRWLLVIAGLFAMLMLLRDSFVPLGAGLIVVALLMCAARRSMPSRPIVGALAALTVVTGVALWSIDAGDRAVRPMTNVVTLRVLPDGDATRFFVDHGLPLTRELEAFRGRVLIGTALDDTGPRPSAQELRGPYRWIDESGRGTYLGYVASHPDVIASRLWEDLDEIFGTQHEIYGRFSHLPSWSGGSDALATVLFPPPAILAIESGLGAVISLLLARWRRAPAAIGLVWCFVAIGLLHAVIGWLGDALEVLRHSLLASVQVRIGVTVILLLVVDELVAGRRAGRVSRVSCARR